MDIGLKIRELRNKKNISIIQIAEHLGVTEQAIYKYEAGKSEPSITGLEKLSNLFGIKISELLDEKLNNLNELDSKFGNSTGLEQVVINVMKETNNDLRKENERLTKEIDYLKSQNERLLVKY